MFNLLITAVFLLLMPGCRHTEPASDTGGTLKSLSSIEEDTLKFFKDRGIVINSSSLKIESFDAEKLELYKILEVGDTLAEIRVLVKGEILQPLDRSVGSLSEAGAILNARHKDKDLATTLRFYRQRTKQLFGVTVSAGP